MIEFSQVEAASLAHGRFSAPNQLDSAFIVNDKEKSRSPERDAISSQVIDVL
jgi:hypothetical protein